MSHPLEYEFGPIEFSEDVKALTLTDEDLGMCPSGWERQWREKQVLVLT